MATEEIHQNFRFLDWKHHKGSYGILAAFGSTVALLLQLPDAQLERLKEIWWIISIPALLLLISTSFTAYISEQKNRTKVELQISEKLSQLANNFEKLLANHWDDRRYFDEQLDSFRERHEQLQSRIDRIYKVLEKRCEEKEVFHSGQTERFLNGDRK